MAKVEIFTDGACLGNPGPGGWAAILRCAGKEKALSGGTAETTNNRMELTAVIEGLKALKVPCKVTVFSDSQYVCNAISKGWATAWQKNNWRKPDKKTALNTDLWAQLLKILQNHQVQFVWVRGHAGHIENERCDALAVEQAKKFK